LLFGTPEPSKESSLRLNATKNLTLPGEPYLPLFYFSDLKFGKVNLSTKEESYQSLIDPESQGESFENLGGFSLEVQGLVLNRYQFDVFTKLMNVISNGEASCEKDFPASGCYLPGSCLNYPSLWDYSFKVEFVQSASKEYMIVPLSSFAVNEAD